MENISGTYICPKCGYKYKWEYIKILRNKFTDSLYHVTTINDVVHVAKDESISDKKKYRFYCDCPHCNELNYFDYEISKN